MTKVKSYAPPKYYHKATYDFMEDNNGDEPAGWTVVDGAGCSTTVISSVNGHVKVLQLDDQSAVNRCYNTISITQLANQTIELWVGKSSIVGDTCSIVLWEGGNRLVNMFLTNDDLRYFDGANKDIKLDEGGANEVTAAEIRTKVDEARILKELILV